MERKRRKERERKGRGGERRMKQGKEEERKVKRHGRNETLVKIPITRTEQSHIQEPGTQPSIPYGLQEPEDLSHHLLLPTVCISRNVDRKHSGI